MGAQDSGYSLTDDELNRAFLRFKDLADKKKHMSTLDLESIINDEMRDVNLKRYELVGMQVRSLLLVEGSRRGFGSQGEIEYVSSRGLAGCAMVHCLRLSSWDVPGGSWQWVLRMLEGVFPVVPTMRWSLKSRTPMVLREMKNSKS